MKQGRFNIVMGGQAGSEGKGKFSAWLASESSPTALFMAASPNAGHTVVVEEEGEGGILVLKKKVTYHLPAAAITTGSDVPIYLGPTSLINPKVFAKELEQTGIDPSRINIDARASIISPEMIEREVDGKLSDIGSTLQGIGELRMAKMGRRTPIPPAILDPILLSIPGLHLNINTCADLNTVMDWGGTVLAEMTQGFDLCLEHGIHPSYCTSKMIHPAMCMAEAGVSPNRIGDIYGVIRPFPIRVNNRTGSSGPYYGAMEIGWDDVARECGYPGDVKDFGEITTTTKLPRRVFTFSWGRYERFVRLCRPDYLCLQFANYLSWSDLGIREWGDLTAKTKEFVRQLGKAAREAGVGSWVGWIGTGPGHEDMVVRRVEE